MAQCVKCKEELDEKARFCLICGTPVEKTGTGCIGEADPFRTVVKACPVYGIVNLEQLPDGHVINDRYEVKEKLGRGGFGAVYRVFDRKMECDKALKVLPEAVASDLEVMENIRKEAVIMARLNHPNIVRIFEFQDKGAVKYIDMEYVDGKSLTELKLAAEGKRLSERKVKAIAVKVAEGLFYAHKQGVIHRDIKLQNILVNAEGTPKITDFGISETVKSSMSRIANTAPSGTLAYMSPEQIRGKNVGREADIYSFGVVLYELLTGSPPFCRGDISWQVLNEAPEPLDGVSSSFGQVVMRCREKDYQLRFPDFKEVRRALAGKNVSVVKQVKTQAMESDIRLVGSAGGAGKSKRSGFTRIVIAVGAVHMILLAIILYRSGEVSVEAVRTQWRNVIEEKKIEKGRLFVDTTPANAGVSFLDGQYVYQDGIPLKAGKYKLVVSRDGYVSQEIQVMVQKGKPTQILVSLKKKVQPGRLYVSPTPPDAVVKVLNIKPKFHQGMILSPGRYHLSASRAGYETRKKWISIEKGQDFRTDMVLTRALPKGPAKKITNTLGMEFVYIKPGTFMMGSPSGEPGRTSSETLHRVTLSKGYYLQVTEVTQGQWKAVIGSNTSWFKRRNPAWFNTCGDNCPVEYVSWEDTRTFIEKLNRMEKGNRYRLPTEAEWEYACRAGTTGPFSFGHCISTDQVNYNGKFSLSGCNKGTYRKKTLPVASFEPNAWGLYDMHGNVLEWCQDWAGGYSSGEIIDPQGAQRSSKRVVRGGDWLNDASHCRSASRFWFAPDNKYSSLGFRLVKNM